MLTAKEKTLFDALEPEARNNGVEIVNLEIAGAKKAPVIRVYIDTPNGVGFDELSQAQAWIGEILDEIDPFPGAYTMEVSSPGIDRPLRTREHFERFSGEKASIRTTCPIDGRSNFKGIMSIEGEEVVVVAEDGKFVIPYELIKKANLIGEIEF